MAVGYRVRKARRRQTNRFAKTVLDLVTTSNGDLDQVASVRV